MKIISHLRDFGNLIGFFRGETPSSDHKVLSSEKTKFVSSKMQLGDAHNTKFSYWFINIDFKSCTAL